MSRATLTFDLNDLSDLEEYKMHNQAKNLTLAIWELVNHDFRQMYKYNGMPNGVHYGHMEDIGFKGPKEEFIPSNLTGLQMLELINTLLREKLAEENVDLGVYS